MSMVNENEQHGPADSGSDVNWRVIAGIVVLALSFVFILQNTDQADINFLFFDFEVGIWFGLLVAFLLGSIVGWGLHVAWRRRKGPGPSKK